VKVLTTTPFFSEIIVTDESVYPVYRRFSNGEWENLMGESWETAWDERELEEAYREFYNHVKEPPDWTRLLEEFKLKVVQI
jgi:hypothetical protein